MFGIKLFEISNRTIYGWNGHRLIAGAQDTFSSSSIGNQQGTFWIQPVSVLVTVALLCALPSHQAIKAPLTARSESCICELSAVIVLRIYQHYELRLFASSCVLSFVLIQKSSLWFNFHLVTQTHRICLGHQRNVYSPGWRFTKVKGIRQFAPRMRRAC